MSKYLIPSIDNVIYSTNLAVRITDINYGNHLGHDSLISFLHEARVRFFKSNGNTELNIYGAGVLVSNLSINYINEAFYADKLTINIGVGGISRSSVELIYQAFIQDSNREIARALTTMVFYDYQNKKVTYYSIFYSKNLYLRLGLILSRLLPSFYTRLSFLRYRLQIIFLQNKF